MMTPEDIDRIAVLEDRAFEQARLLMDANESLIALASEIWGPQMIAKTLKIMAGMIERGKTGAGTMH